MNLHEYQAKELLKSYGLPIPEFVVASSVDEAKKVKWDQAVLKIQVHAGGRGKAGGVKFAKTHAEIASVAAKLIGMKMVNNQTGPEGIIAHKILISKPVDIEKEFYLSLLIDRDSASPILIASPEGGMEIEEIAVKRPEKILKLKFTRKLRPYQLLRLAKFMGWQGAIAKQGIGIAEMLAKCFMESDASLVEINPLVLTKEGELTLLDAKLSIDDNALFRHKDLADYYDPTQVSPQEAAAKQFDLAYIAMEGEIGCMVNGAGLAMATMDIIQLFGGSPANFLDVGGSATKEKVSEGFKIILSDPKVKAILVNIFGGIMNCGTLALGIVHACREQNVKVPLIVRMEGTNVQEGKRILKESELKIESVDDFQKAAETAVRRANGDFGK
jgi:succinyl-CoA synthetase beta subunit